MRIKTNNKGVSLVETIIAGGIMMGIALAGMQIIENQNKQLKILDLSLKSTQFLSQVERLINIKEICITNLKDKTLDEEYHEIVDRNGEVVYTSENKDNWAYDVFKYYKVQEATGGYNFVIGMRDLSVSSGVKEVTTPLELAIDNNKVTECYNNSPLIEEAIRQMCIAFGTVYDETNKKCESFSENNFEMCTVSDSTAVGNDPIWGNYEAASKCNPRCESYDDGTWIWKGGWWTTVWGSESVCLCVKERVCTDIRTYVENVIASVKAAEAAAAAAE